MTDSTNSFATLVQGEEPVPRSEELLWRQVHPDWIHDGRLTSQTFSKSTSDINGPSVVRESAMTAEDAYHFHTRDLQNASAGTWAVSVEEVMERDMRVVEDGGAPNVSGKKRPKGHAYLDGRHLSGGQLKKHSKILRDLAEARGRFHP